MKMRQSPTEESDTGVVIHAGCRLYAEEHGRDPTKICGFNPEGPKRRQPVPCEGIPAGSSMWSGSAPPGRCRAPTEMHCTQPVRQKTANCACQPFFPGNQVVSICLLQMGKHNTAQEIPVATPVVNQGSRVENSPEKRADTTGRMAQSRPKTIPD